MYLVNGDLFVTLAIQKVAAAYDVATNIITRVSNFTCHLRYPSFTTTSQIAPVLLPALLSVLEGRERCGKESSSGSSSGTVGLESALACIAVLLNGLKGGSTRPFLRRVEHVACCVLGWDDDDVTDAVGDRLRETAACVLSLVPHCGKEVESAWEGTVEAWCAEGISLLTAAWPPRGGNGKTSSTTSKPTATSVHSFHYLSPPPPSKLSDMNSSGHLLAVCRRFNGICTVLSYMLRGSTFGRFVHVPTSCILNLIVQALTFDFVEQPRRGRVKKGIRRAVEEPSQSSVSVISPQTTTQGGAAMLSSKFMFMHQVIRRIRSYALRVLVAMVSAPSAALVRHARRLMECITTCIEAETVENCKPDSQALLALGILSRQLGPGFTAIAAAGALPALYRALNRCRAWKQQPAFSCNDQKPQKARKRPRGGNNNIPPQTTTILDGRLPQDKWQQFSFSSGDGLIPDYSTSGPAGWDEADLSCFSAAGIRALANVVSSGGGYLPKYLRSQAETLAGDAIISLRNRNTSGGGIESCERAAWVRGDQAAIAAVDLVISCVQAPLWDGTRSPLVGRAVEMFRWLLSRGESEEMQSAAQNGLSACQALLNPRFAPLMKPTADISSHTSPAAVAASLPPPPIDNNLAKSSENTVAKAKQDDIGDQSCGDDDNAGGGSSVEEDKEEGSAAMKVVGTTEVALKEDESGRIFNVVVEQQDNDVGGVVAFKDDASGHNTENDNKEGSNTAEVTPEDESGENESRTMVTGESKETGNGKCKNPRVAEDLGGCSDNHQYTGKKSRNDSLIPSRCTNEDINTFCGSTLSSLSAAPLKSSGCMIRNDSDDSSSCGSLPEIDIEDLTD